MNKQFEEKVKYYEKHIGDSLLLVKCYELMGKAEDAMRVAKNVSTIELVALNKLLSENHTIDVLAEQFLRVIYAYHMAGQNAVAINIMEKLMNTAKKDNQDFGRINAKIALTIATALVLLNDREIKIETDFGSDTFSGKLINAWKNNNVEMIESCCAEMDEYIEAAENQEMLVPWSDVWHYIIVHRLKELLSKDSARQ